MTFKVPNFGVLGPKKNVRTYVRAYMAHILPANFIAPCHLIFLQIVATEAGAGTGAVKNAAAPDV